MNMVDLISFILSNARSKIPIQLLFIVIFAAYTQLTIVRITKRANYTSVEYAYEVIAFGLSNAASSDDISKQIATWHHDKWGAQVAALRAVCREQPTLLLKIMGNDDAKRACRLVL